MSKLTGKQWEERLETTGISTLEVWAIISDLIAKEEQLTTCRMQWSVAKSELAEMRDYYRWIPVSERLPEDTMIYDVSVAGYQYSWTGSCVFGKWIGESGKAILGVTHWKYRPQLPKESEGE